MTHTKQSAWFKSGVRVLVILVLLVVPASLLAWFCGTGRMTGGGKLLQCTSDGSTCVDVTGATSPTSAGVTNGYELHCDGSYPNNLQINDHLSSSFHFHLEILMTANCFDDGLASSTPLLPALTSLSVKETELGVTETRVYPPVQSGTLSITDRVMPVPPISGSRIRRPQPPIFARRSRPRHRTPASAHNYSWSPLPLF